MFDQGKTIEWAAGDFEQLYVGEVFFDADVEYALLMDKRGKFAAASAVVGDDDAWYFVKDDEVAWRDDKWQALMDIADGMREVATL